MKARLATSLAPAWPNIRIVRREVGEALVGYPTEVRDASVMTVSELIENAIKYGSKPPPESGISFALLGDSEQISIEVTNRASAADVHLLRLRVMDISAAADKRSLYMKRLAWLLAHPTENGQLGLCRVAYEGRFGLEVSYSDGAVSVRAQRSIT